MPLLNNFLGCFELETGGILISCLGMIGTALTALLAGSLLLNDINNCQYHDNCSEKWIITAIVILILLGFFFIYALLFSGVRNRKHKKVFPALVISIVGAIFSVLGLFTALSNKQAQGIGGAIFYTVVQIYFYFIIRELYIKFKSEANNTRANYAA
ncbi:hypothetical protein PVAND_007672 [Polypedilum vanderplanki]|uniref:DUF7027 domain-containing protein n=1 Tax=Polypedilum vanderplanki TaxID=319348 RepID=A0A9J6C7N8_POLVA|nr:hypothetical protein PVAND_007672 [Polypedilum vanderplanki]